MVIRTTGTVRAQTNKRISKIPSCVEQKRLTFGFILAVFPYYNRPQKGPRLDNVMFITALVPSSATTTEKICIAVAIIVNVYPQS